MKNDDEETDAAENGCMSKLGSLLSNVQNEVRKSLEGYKKVKKEHEEHILKFQSLLEAERRSFLEFMDEKEQLEMEKEAWLRQKRTLMEEVERFQEKIERVTKRITTLQRENQRLRSMVVLDK